MCLAWRVLRVGEGVPWAGGAAPTLVQGQRAELWLELTCAWTLGPRGFFFLVGCWFWFFVVLFYHF